MGINYVGAIWDETWNDGSGTQDLVWSNLKTSGRNWEGTEEDMGIRLKLQAIDLSNNLRLEWTQMTFERK